MEMDESPHERIPIFREPSSSTSTSTSIHLPSRNRRTVFFFVIFVVTPAGFVFHMNISRLFLLLIKSFPISISEIRTIHISDFRDLRSDFPKVLIFKSFLIPISTRNIHLQVFIFPNSYC